MPRVAKENKRLVDSPFSWIALITSAIVLMVLAVFVTFQDQLFEGKVLAVVGDKKITEADLNQSLYSRNLKGSAQDPLDVSQEDKEEALEYLIDSAVIETEAEENEVTVSDDEMDAYAEENIMDWEFYSGPERDAIKTSLKYQLLKEKIKHNVLGWREGQFVVLHFDRYLEDAQDATPVEIAENSKNRDQKYQDEKTYATNLAKSLYDDVKSGSITFEEAMDKANKDSRAGADSFSPSSVVRSSSFTKKDWENDNYILDFDGFKKKALEVDKDGMSEPFNITLTLLNEEQKEGLVVFLKNENGNDGKHTKIEDWLTSKKDEIGVKKYTKEKGFIEEVYADADGPHTTPDSSKWGVNTGSAGSAAGMIIRTKIRWIDGSESWLNNVNVRVERNSGSGTSFYYTDDSTWDDDETTSTARDFKTGAPNGPIYSGPVGTSNHYHSGGTIVLGYGTSSNHGNRWTLDCDWNYNIDALTSVSDALALKGLSPTDYKGSWSSVDGTSVVNGGNTWKTLIFTLERNSWDSLAINDFKVTSPSDTEVGCENNTGSYSFSWTLDHQRNPEHGIESRKIQFYPEGPWETITEDEATHTYKLDQTNLDDSTTSEDITVTVQVKCKGGITKTSTVSAPVKLQEPDVLCHELKASPSSGYVPLAVRFTANITDHLCNPVTGYRWIFDSDTEPTNWEDARQTTAPSANYTYVEVGSHTAWVVGEDSSGNVTNTCSGSGDGNNNSKEINSETWSQSDYQEIAP